MIRAARPDDLPAIARIEAVADPGAWTEGSLAAWVQRDGRATWVAADAEDRVVGHLIGQRVLDEAEVVSVAVSTEHRRLGWGERLLTAALDTWRTSGVQHVFLEVKALNDPARRLYERAGFEAYGSRPRYYRDGSDAILYRRALTQLNG